MLSARDLRFAYPSGEFALRVSMFDTKPGELVGLAGPSGTGKTTFLRLLSGILKPGAGEVAVDGEKLEDLTEGKRRTLRLEKLGLVFQDFELLDYLSVEDNVLLPSRLQGRLSTALREAARCLVEQLEIGHHWKRLTGELSQGERQRMAVARALLHRPRVVLADEPTSSLDAKRKTLVMDLITDYAKMHKAAVVLVTHDVEILTRLDRTVNVETWAS